MTTKAIIVMSLILGMGQMSFAAIDRYQLENERGVFKTASLTPNFDCPFKAKAGRDDLTTATRVAESTSVDPAQSRGQGAIN